MSNNPAGIQSKNSFWLILLSSFFFYIPCGAESPTSKDTKQSNDSIKKESRKKSSVSLTYYFDSRDYNTLNIVTSFPDLPAQFIIWGFMDLHGDQKNSSQRFDLTRYFLEYRLSRPIFSNSVNFLKGIGLEAEYNDFNGSHNSVVRFGPTY